MSFFENLTRPLVSFANDAVRTVGEEVVNPTVSFANNAVRTVGEEVVNPTVSLANDAVRTVGEEVVNPTVSFANDAVRTVGEEVVNPTVSFANDAVRTVAEEVVNPTVSFANNAARTVAEEVVNPTVSFASDAIRTLMEEVVIPTADFANDVVGFIETQFQRPWNVLEQQIILDNLQGSSGLDFPGSDYRPTDRKNWMGNLSNNNLTLNKIVWPGTHNSATNGIGSPVFTRWLGECQTRSIYEQLVLGTRVLDIRVQKDHQICHGDLTSYNIDIVIDDIIKFLLETPSEIIILEIRTEYGHNDPPEFQTYLADKLGKYLIHQDDNLFNKPISEILPKRIICIWKPRESPKPSRGGLLWSSDYLKDNWTNTDLPWTKFQSNMNHLKEQPPISSKRLFYRVENTLTPQKDNPVVFVYPVTNRIRGYARLFISRCISEGCGDKLQIFSTDFIEEDFVDACAGLTQARIDGRV